MDAYNRLAALVALSCVGLALLGCAALERGTAAGTNPPSASAPLPNAARITESNANQVVHLARLREGSFTARAAWSPDGRTLALPSAYGVYLFDANTLTRVRMIEETERVENIAFSRDSSLLAIETSRATPWSANLSASPSAERTVRLWRVSDGTLVREFKREAWAGSAAFSPDNTQLVTHSAQNTARVWRVSDGTLVRELKLTQPDDKDTLTRITFSPDWSTALAISTAANAPKTRVRVWRIGDGNFLRELTEAEVDLDSPDNLGYSPDGTLIVSTNALYIRNAIGQPRNGTAVRLWRVNDGTLAREWREERILSNVMFSPDGGWLITTDVDKLRIRQTRDGALVRDLNGAWNIAPSPDGKLIASRNETHMVNDFSALSIWRVSDGALVRELKEQFAVDGVRLSREASVLAAGRLWRMTDQKFALTTQLKGLSDHVDSFAVSLDGKLAATGGLRNMRLWQTSDGTLVREEKGFADRVTHVAFNPDATLLATASADRVAQVWRVGDGALVRALGGHEDAVTGLTFSPDGAWLASATRNTVRLWRVNDGTLVREAKGGWQSVTFSPDSTLLVATDAGGTLGLWRVSDGTLVRELKVADVISGTAFSADGNLLAVSYLGGTLRLWRVSDGTLLRETKDAAFIGTGESIAFSQDGSTLLTGNGSAAGIGTWGIPRVR